MVLSFVANNNHGTFTRKSAVIGDVLLRKAMYVYRAINCVTVIFDLLRLDAYSNRNAFEVCLSPQKLHLRYTTLPLRHKADVYVEQVIELFFRCK